MHRQSQSLYIRVCSLCAFDPIRKSNAIPEKFLNLAPLPKRRFLADPSPSSLTPICRYVVGMEDAIEMLEALLEDVSSPLVALLPII
jgi:hypothetical protein